MAKNTFSVAEIAVFAIMTLQKQVDDGYIDDEHLPPIDMKSATDVQIAEVEAKIQKTGKIPHENDILNMTRSFYKDDDDFTEYFRVLCERIGEDKSLTETFH